MAAVLIGQKVGLARQRVTMTSIIYILNVKMTNAINRNKRYIMNTCAIEVTNISEIEIVFTFFLNLFLSPYNAYFTVSYLIVM